eukprot:scaffold97_cov128-Isochrysis_galbana.AAC.1
MVLFSSRSCQPCSAITADVSMRISRSSSTQKEESTRSRRCDSPAEAAGKLGRGNAAVGGGEAASRVAMDVAAGWRLMSWSTLTPTPSTAESPPL